MTTIKGTDQGSGPSKVLWARPMPRLLSITFLLMLLVPVLMVPSSMATDSRANPVVSCDLPNPSKFRLGDLVMITGSISDDGEVVTVDLTTNGGISWTDITSGFNNVTWRYEWGWTTMSESSGPHQVSVRVKDDESRTGIVGVNVILDGDVPDLDIDEPEDGATLGLGDEITISGEVRDKTTSVVLLNISFDDGDTWEEIIDELDGREWSYKWSTKANDAPGDYDITVKATDEVGQEEEVTITVTLVDIVGPEVTVISPLEDTIFTEWDSVPLRGSATDNIGVTELKVVITNVEGSFDITSRLYAGAWTWAWDSEGEPIGDYLVTVTAKDAEGNEGSATVNMTFLDDEDPVLQMKGPLDGAKVKVTAGDPVRLWGKVTDNVALETLEVSVDGLAAEDITSEVNARGDFSYNLVGLKAKKHTIEVTATDTADRKTKETITIKVQKKEVPAAVGSGVIAGAVGGVIALLFIILLIAYWKGYFPPGRRKVPGVGAVAHVPPPPGSEPDTQYRSAPPPTSAAGPTAQDDMYADQAGTAYGQASAEEGYPSEAYQEEYVEEVPTESEEEGPLAPEAPPPKKGFTPPALAKNPQQAPEQCPACGLDIDYETLACPECGAKLY